MNRNLSKHPKVVRHLDGALTAWRYFHGPNFACEARYRRKTRTCAKDRTLEDEREALFTVIVRFVEWMQAPISAIATNAPPAPPDTRTATQVLADLGALEKTARSDIARAMSRGRPNSPFYTGEL